MAGKKSTDEKVEEVCNFLKIRNVERNVINKFKDEKMDFDAIAMSSDEDLKQLGLAKKGDILSLKNFCQQHMPDKKVDETKHEKKRLLQSILNFGKSSKRSKASPESVKNAVGSSTTGKTRKVHLGWMNYSDEQNSLIQVRAKKGGGTRVVDVAVSANIDAIIRIGKELFFPDGKSDFGNIDEFHFGLANFKCEDLLKAGNGLSETFTLQKYVNEVKMKRVLLYIITKKNDLENDEFYSDSDSDVGVVVSTDFVETEEVHLGNPSSIIMRRELIAQQDQAYKESLEADMAKEESKRFQLLAELTNAERQENLMNSRCARVPEEPVEGEDKVVVHVRHTTLGMVKRSFRPTCNMNAVYDWVGSLSLTPEHFTLTDFEANSFEEEQSVRDASSVVLYMRERCDDDDDDDDLPKFLVSSDSEASNSLMHVHEPNEFLPSKIMEEDESDHENGSIDVIETSTQSQETFPSATYREQLRQLQRLRNVIAESGGTESEEPYISRTDAKNLQCVREVRVRRETIVDDVLDLFRDPTILQCSLAVTFDDETGLDFGGLTQELFSTFWDAVWDKYFEGETAKVPFVPPQSIANSKAAFTAIGRVLAHGWVLTKQIPILFCEASLIAAIHGQDKVTDDILLKSFHFYISQFERDILQRVATGDSKQPCVVDSLWSIYTRFGMTCPPADSSAHLNTHIIEMARSEFLFKPMVLLQWIKEGIMESDMQLVSSQLSLEKIQKLYEDLPPSNEKVLQMITHKEDVLRSDQQRVLDFLKISVGNMDENLLAKFLRFVTASTVSPQKPIVVQFNAATGLKRAPSTYTCSNTLILPTTYSSLGEFKRELYAILGHNESFDFMLP